MSTEATATAAPAAPMKIVLPRMLVKSVTVWPNNMIIFSKPKTGKTTLFSLLPDCLILDLEKGSKYVDALKLEANSIQDIKAIGTEILAQGCPYKFIAVDTVTKLEDMCIPMAEQLYSQTAMGKNWFTPSSGGKAQYGNILNMPNGSGYPWLTLALDRVIDYLKTLAPNIILSGHIKSGLLDKANGEFNSAELDLTGKNKRKLCSASDAIGYLYRKGNQTILSFKSSDEISCGARPQHLKGQEIVIAEQAEDGSIQTYWDRIYPVNPVVAPIALPQAA